MQGFAPGLGRMLLRNADRQSPLSSSQTAAQCDTQRLDTVRDRMLDRYIQTLDAIIAAKTSVKVVAYLSVKFLTGPHLRNSLINLGIWDPTREAISKVGQNLSELIGVAYDTPVPGYRVSTTNLLRLWKAEAAESFDFEAFNVGDYYGAVDEKIVSETISKVLYPNDEPEAGKRLRLAQQYFFVSCSLQDRALKAWHGKSENLKVGQQAFYHRAMCDSAAALGKYTAAMESESAAA